MIAEELALYLQTMGHGTQGKNLFLAFQPDSPDNCITVYDESTPAPEESNPFVDEFGVQIISGTYTTLEIRFWLCIRTWLVSVGCLLSPRENGFMLFLSQQPQHPSDRMKKAEASGPHITGCGWNHRGIFSEIKN